MSLRKYNWRAKFVLELWENFFKKIKYNSGAKLVISCIKNKRKKSKVIDFPAYVKVQG